jgi:hypothetical protein
LRYKEKVRENKKKNNEGQREFVNILFSSLRQLNILINYLTLRYKHKAREDKKKIKYIKLFVFFIKISIKYIIPNNIKRR